MLTHPAHQELCTKAVLLVFGALTIASIATGFVKPAQHSEAPAAKDDIVHVSYGVDYVPTCSVPVNLMRPPGTDLCTGQPQNAGDVDALQISIPLTFRK
jgi:hypothetical protein